MTYEIYFEDLNPGAQQNLLEAANITKPEDANWDVFPIAYIEIPTLDDLQPDLDDRPLRVCEHCLWGIESHEGSVRSKRISVDPEDAEESMCEWCKESGFDTLYEIG